MKKIILLIIVSVSISNMVNGQITNGNWMLGGNASFSSSKYGSTGGVQYSQTDIQVSPLIGYFAINNFAVGLKPSLIYGSYNSSANGTTNFSVGPFTRYYFLKPENRVNVFTEGAYAYGISKAKNESAATKLNTFSISAGSVVYFNSSVGLEFTLGYTTTKIVGHTGNNSVIRLGIGFQFHFEKEK